MFDHLHRKDKRSSLVVESEFWFENPESRVNTLSISLENGSQAFCTCSTVFAAVVGVPTAKTRAETNEESFREPLRREAASQQG